MENVSLLLPETFLKTMREEIRDLEEGKLVLEGQKVQLLRQQKENREAISQGKEQLALLEAQISILEQKREASINRPALKKQLEGLHLRVEELLRDKPEEVPPELLEQLRQAELAQERLRVKRYEGKFTAALAETQAALQAAAAEHKQVSVLLSSLARSVPPVNSRSRLMRWPRPRKISVKSWGRSRPVARGCVPS